MRIIDWQGVGFSWLEKKIKYFFGVGKIGGFGMGASDIIMDNSSFLFVKGGFSGKAFWAGEMDGRG